MRANLVRAPGDGPRFQQGIFSSYSEYVYQRHSRLPMRANDAAAAIIGVPL
jgi:hypothetical protein